MNWKIKEINCIRVVTIYSTKITIKNVGSLSLIYLHASDSKIEFFCSVF